MKGKQPTSAQHMFISLKTAGKAPSADLTKLGENMCNTAKKEEGLRYFDFFALWFFHRFDAH